MKDSFWKIPSERFSVEESLWVKSSAVTQDLHNRGGFSRWPVEP
jgi:hypothetical protein